VNPNGPKRGPKPAITGVHPIRVGWNGGVDVDGV